MMAPEPSRESQPFRPDGMGYVYRPDDAPYLFRYDRFSRKGDEEWAEVVVETAAGAHLARRRINLSGGTSMGGLVRDLKDLSDGDGTPWLKLVMEGAESSILARRAGPPLHTYGGQLRRPPPLAWACCGLVQARKINCWLAAGGTGKSTFATAFCLHHALGEPFLGREVQRGVPLYLDWEGTDDDFEETLYLTANGLGLDAVPPIHRYRMPGPLRGREHWLAQKIDRLGATLLVIDAVAAAGGQVGDGGGASYEAVALSLEETLHSLPPITVLLIDHVTSDEIKGGGVPIKARGAARKYEFVRYQWTLSLDQDAKEDRRHVVGWTHTKANRGETQAPFGVELVHGEDSLTFRTVDRAAVAPLAARMTAERRIAALVRHGALTIKEIALELYGSDDDRACSKVRANVSRDHGKRLVRLPDGRIGARGEVFPSTMPRNIRPLRATTDDEREGE